MFTEDNVWLLKEYKEFISKLDIKDKYLLNCLYIHLVLKRDRYSALHSTVTIFSTVNGVRYSLDAVTLTVKAVEFNSINRLGQLWLYLKNNHDTKTLCENIILLEKFMNSLDSEVELNKGEKYNRNQVIRNLKQIKVLLTLKR